MKADLSKGKYGRMDLIPESKEDEKYLDELMENGTILVLSDKTSEIGGGKVLFYSFVIYHNAFNMWINPKWKAAKQKELEKKKEKIE